MGAVIHGRLGSDTRSRWVTCGSDADTNPSKFLIPEIFFRPGSPRPFISSELLAHLGDSGRLRSPIKSAKKSLCRGSSPSLGISTCGEIVDVDANCRRYSHTQTPNPTVLHIAIPRVPCAPWNSSWDNIFVAWLLRSAHWVTQHSSSLRSLVDGKSPSSGRKKPLS